MVTDFQQAAEYISCIVRLEVLTDGPVGVGTRFRETRIMFGREATEEMEITGFDLPHSLTIERESCGYHYLARHRFLPDIAGTCVQLEMDAKPVSLLAKLMSPVFGLMKGSMKKLIDADLDDLKPLAEERADTVKQAY